MTKKIDLDTNGGVNVLCLIEGEQVVVESPDQEFDPFMVHFAEVFIVPAGVGKYSIKLIGKSAGKKLAIIRAYVRANA